MTLVIPIRGLTRPLGVFDFTGDALENFRENIETPNQSDAFVDLRLSAQDKYAVMQLQSANTLHAGLWADGGAITWGSGLDVGSDAPYIRPHPIDPTLFMSISPGNTQKAAVYQINESDLSITKLHEATASTTGISSNGNWADWNATGDRLCVGTDSRLYLFSWNGSTLTLLDDVAVFSGGADRCQPHFVPDKELIFCGGDNDNRMYLVSYTGDTLTITDNTTLNGGSAVAFGRSTVSPDGAWGLNAGRVGFDNCCIIGINADGTFGAQTTFPDDFTDARFIGTDRIVTAEDTNQTNSPIRVYSWDGSTLTELFEDFSSVFGSQRLFLEVTKPTPPPTIQQQFEVTYAEVSGRDPLPTALSQRAPARNLVNYYVSNFAGVNRRRVTTERVIPPGQLHLARPAPAAGDRARMIWIEDPRSPDFWMGRWAVIVGATAGSSKDKVVLELEIANNPESFVRPT